MKSIRNFLSNVYFVVIEAVVMIIILVALLYMECGADIVQVFVGASGLIVAIIAILMTRSEIKAQNNQCLFEKRVANYITCKKLYILVEENLSLLDCDWPEDDPIEVTMPFLFLTNCAFLEEASGIINDVSDFNLRKIFLRKVEYLVTISEKSRLLFPFGIGESLGDFVFAFQSTIMQLYRYQVLLGSIYDFQKNHPVGLRKTFSELARMFKEDKIRDELKEATELLKKTFEGVKEANALRAAQEITRL